VEFEIFEQLFFESAYAAALVVERSDII